MLVLLATITTATLGFSAREIPGVYYQGDGLGVNLYLELRKDGRFSYSWHGCLGEYDKNSGFWTLRGDVLTLSPERPGKMRMDLRFVPVKWGERVCLIDDHEMPGFAATAAHPSEYETRPREYTKVNGKFEPSKRFGVPVLPARYRFFYEKGAVKARIVRLDQGRATLDRGSALGMRAGLRLATDWGSREVEVVSVGKDACVGRVWYLRGNDRRLGVGDRLSTGGEWQRPGGTGSRRYASFDEAKRAKD